ncbi:MAG: hypothetical protein JSW34_01210, partial [Candidatus Zixiibacteriota bacterium]
MKNCLLLLLIIGVLISTVSADESSCPARRAAEKGFKAIEQFHHVLGPAWHSSWSAKDYDALIAAGPKFDESFKAIAELEMVFKTEKRTDNFVKGRDELAAAVKQYSEACQAGDKEKVYELMPAL